MRPTPASSGPDDAEVLWDNLAGLVEGVIARWLPADRLVVCGTGCGGPMSPGGDEVSPLNIAGWRSFPLRSRLVGTDRAPDVRRQRRQGAGPRRGVGRRGGGVRRLHRHGRVDGRGRRHRARRRAAQRPARQCGPHRPRRRRPRRARLRVRQPWLPRGGGVGYGAGRPDGPAGAAGVGGVGGAHRHARRSRHRRGGRPARPVPGGGERIGGAGVRRALLRGRPGGDGSALPDFVRPGGAGRARRAGRRRPARRRGPGGACGAGLA